MQPSLAVPDLGQHAEGISKRDIVDKGAESGLRRPEAVNAAVAVREPYARWAKCVWAPAGATFDPPNYVRAKELTQKGPKLCGIQMWTRWLSPVPCLGWLGESGGFFFRF